MCAKITPNSKKQDMVKRHCSSLTEFDSHASPGAFVCITGFVSHMCVRCGVGTSDW